MLRRALFIVLPVLVAVVGVASGQTPPVPSVDLANPNPGWSSAAKVEANFNAMRRLEEADLCAPSNSLGDLSLPSDWDSWNADDRMLFLVNAERVARGGVAYGQAPCDDLIIPAGLPYEIVEFHLDTVAQNIAEAAVEANVYTITGTISALNADPVLRPSSGRCFDYPGPTTGGSTWFVGNYVVNGTGLHNYPIERALYDWIYGSSLAATPWYHRQMILQQNNTNDHGSPNAEGILGVGYVTDSEYRPFPGFGQAMIVVLYSLDPKADSNACTDDYSTEQVVLDASILLEGASDGLGGMDVPASFSSVVPTTQPYSHPRFDGTILELDRPDVLSSFPSGTVDWLNLSLRTGTSSASEVANSGRAVVVADTGQVVDLNGAPVIFPGIVAGPYRVVARHRNHSSVMSMSALDFTQGLVELNFRSNLSDAYTTGPPAMKSIGDKFGMFACDIVPDGQITANDFNEWLTATKAVTTGYVEEDCNLDTNVTASDFNIWLTNTKAVHASQVPD